MYTPDLNVCREIYSTLSTAAAQCCLASLELQCKQVSSLHNRHSTGCRLLHRQQLTLVYYISTAMHVQTIFYLYLPSFCFNKMSVEVWSW